MDRINDEYVPAVLDGRIALVTNLGRYLGRMTRSGLRKWQAEGLVVVVDDLHFTMVATYRRQLVAASLPNQLIFIMGDWWQIIERRRDEIMHHQAHSQQESGHPSYRQREGQDPGSN